MWIQGKCVWFRLLGGLRNLRFEKSGFHCVYDMFADLFQLASSAKRRKSQFPVADSCLVSGVPCLWSISVACRGALYRVIIYVIWGASSWTPALLMMIFMDFIGSPERYLFYCLPFPQQPTCVTLFTSSLLLPQIQSVMTGYESRILGDVASWNTWRRSLKVGIKSPGKGWNKLEKVAQNRWS